MDRGISQLGVLITQLLGPGQMALCRGDQRLGQADVGHHPGKLGTLEHAEDLVPTSRPEMRGATVARPPTKLLAGVAVAALAAAAVAAVVDYRRGQRLDPDQRVYLNELDARLEVAEGQGNKTPPDRLGRILDRLQRDRGISVGRLRGWITGVRQGKLSPEQATAAESDFDSLERELDQGGV